MLYWSYLILINMYARDPIVFCEYSSSRRIREIFEYKIPSEKKAPWSLVKIFAQLDKFRANLSIQN